MYDFHDRCIHLRRLQILVRAKVKLTERLSKELCFVYVDSHELEDPILGKDADDHCTLGFIIDVHQRYSTRARLKHAPACFVERPQRMDRNRLDGTDTDGPFNVYSPSSAFARDSRT